MDTFQSISNKDFFKSINNNKGEVYFVGGCVRDFLLKKTPKDIDVVVRGIDYQQLVNLLATFGKVDVVGESFGVIKFKEFVTNFEIEIALPRVDIKDENNKGHKAIIAQSNPFLSIEDDLYRRDLTINSIALDINMNFIDPYNGINDLKKKRIVATNKNAFKEDPLRMLRAIQFAARFDFDIEEKTLSLICQNAEQIKDITAERILMEFQKVFDKNGNVKKFLSLLVSKTPLFQKYFGHGLFYNQNIIKSEITNLAEFLYYCFSASHYNDLIPFLQKKLKIDNNLAKQIKAIDYVFKNNETDKNVVCFNAFKIYDKAHELNLIKENFIEFIDKGFPRSYNDLALSGDDIQKFLGIEEGPKIGEIRRALLDAILTEKIRNDFDDCLVFSTHL